MSPTTIAEIPNRISTFPNQLTDIPFSQGYILNPSHQPEPSPFRFPPLRLHEIIHETPGAV